MHINQMSEGMRGLLTSTAFNSSGEYTGWKRTQSPRTIVGTVLVASGVVRAPFFSSFKVSSTLSVHPKSNNHDDIAN